MFDYLVTKETGALFMENDPAASEIGLDTDSIRKKTYCIGKNSTVTPKQFPILPPRVQIYVTTPSTREKAPSPGEKIPATQE